jgi:hypothetical protein
MEIYHPTNTCPDPGDKLELWAIRGDEVVWGIEPGWSGEHFSGEGWLGRSPELPLPAAAAAAAEVWEEEP